MDVFSKEYWELRFSKELMDNKEIETVLKQDIVDRHSFFQLKYFIIGKEPTHQAKLWRCLRELKARKEAIESIKFEIEDTEDEVLLIKCDLLKEESEKANIKNRRSQRRIGSLENKVVELKRKKKFTEEEAEFFLKAYKSLEEKESIKPFDDLKSQVEYWNNKLTSELNLKAILHQLPDVELLRTILALDNNIQVKKDVLKMIEVIPNQTKELTK